MRNKTLIIRWLIILLISFLYGASLYPYADFWPLVGISLCLGCVTALGVGLLIDTVQRRSDAQLIKAALVGQRCEYSSPRRQRHCQ